jgi:hypothetical protein
MNNDEVINAVNAIIDYCLEYIDERNSKDKKVFNEMALLSKEELSAKLKELTLEEINILHDILHKPKNKNIDYIAMKNNVSTRTLYRIKNKALYYFRE